MNTLNGILHKASHFRADTVDAVWEQNFKTYRRQHISARLKAPWQARIKLPDFVVAVDMLSRRLTRLSTQSGSLYEIESDDKDIQAFITYFLTYAMAQNAHDRQLTSLVRNFMLTGMGYSFVDYDLAVSKDDDGLETIVGAYPVITRQHPFSVYLYPSALDDNCFIRLLAVHPLKLEAMKDIAGYDVRAIDTLIKKVGLKRTYRGSAKPLTLSVISHRPGYAKAYGETSQPYEQSPLLSGAFIQLAEFWGSFGEPDMPTESIHAILGPENELVFMALNEHWHQRPPIAIGKAKEEEGRIYSESPAEIFESVYRGMNQVFNAGADAVKQGMPYRHINPLGLRNIDELEAEGWPPGSTLISQQPSPINVIGSQVDMRGYAMLLQVLKEALGLMGLTQISRGGYSPDRTTAQEIKSVEAYSQLLLDDYAVEFERTYMRNLAELLAADILQYQPSLITDKISANMDEDTKAKVQRICDRSPEDRKRMVESGYAIKATGISAAIMRETNFKKQFLFMKLVASLKIAPMLGQNLLKLLGQIASSIGMDARDFLPQGMGMAPASNPVAYETAAGEVAGMPAYREDQAGRSMPTEQGQGVPGTQELD